ncbi:hypothetical protein MTR67_031876 [Solanum verrucosum]|uniref:Uncharacterized protein n=1 Tax=Solanum verrucosum TaxID=315347 RepID=A0AAF0ZEK1_SOLVR|nr:hypothetical protein MTR67_031876 [Solanum verrucosum]
MLALVSCCLWYSSKSFKARSKSQRPFRDNQDAILQSGCGHASEMFGFAKYRFMSCAKEWGEETLMKELDYVWKIFQGSEDLKGKELHVKANVLHTKGPGKPRVRDELHSNAMIRKYGSWAKLNPES